MKPTHLAAWIVAGASALTIATALAAQEKTPPRRPPLQLTPEGRDFLQEGPQVQQLLRLPPASRLPRYTMPIVVKDPADYPIVVTRGKDAIYPIRLVPPQGIPQTPGDGSTPPRLVIPLPAPPKRNPG